MDSNYESAGGFGGGFLTLAFGEIWWQLNNFGSFPLILGASPWIHLKTKQLASYKDERWWMVIPDQVGL